MTRSLAVACGAALLAAGCSLAPALVPPPAPIPAAWPGGEATGDTAAPAEWRAFFSEPGLQSAIGQALENNRDLRIALLRVDEARSVYGVQRSERLPTVGAQAGSGRAQTPADLSSIGRSVTTNQYNADLNLSWELDLWGRVRSLEGAALEQYLATEEASHAAALSLVSAVARTWLQQRELDERIVLADRTLATRRDAARIARRRHEVGSSSRFDMIQAETLLAQAEGERIALVQSRQEATNALTLLVGGPVTDTTLPLSQVEQALSANPPPGLPSDLLAKRPDIRSAEHALRSANADIGAARAAYFPRIALTGLFGSASTDLDHLFEGTGNRRWNFAGAATAPIFDAGRTRGNVDAAWIRRDIATADYERAIQAAFREVADALAARRGLSEQVVVRERTLAAATERSRLANLRYGSGVAAYIEVLDAERDRFASEQALASARGSLLASRVSLYAALGGGDDLLPTFSSERTR